jgi:LmbE family N-acetylglucosaminyl deacetylase
MKKAIVFAPHPDDEILGVGGTIAKLVESGWDITVVIVTKGFTPMFDEELIERGRKEAKEAHSFLGVKRTIFLDKYPAAKLDQVSHSELNHDLEMVMTEVNPKLIFIPFLGDIHNDHQLIFRSLMVASRPNRQDIPRKILAYETLSETFWNAPYITPSFNPNVFVDISDYLEQKIKAMSIYSTQLKQFPQQRSLQAIRALAEFRGSTINVSAAEGFVLIREII